MYRAHSSFLYVEKYSAMNDELRCKLSLELAESTIDLTMIVTCPPLNSVNGLSQRTYRPFREYLLEGPGPGFFYPRDDFPTADVERTIEHAMSPWSTVMFVADWQDRVETARMKTQTFLLNSWEQDQTDFATTVNKWLSSRAETFEVAP